MSNPPDDSLSSLWRRLADLLKNPNWDGNDVNPLLKQMADATRQAAEAELSAVASEMAAAVKGAPYQEAGIIALCVGTIIEYGGKPDDMFEAMTSRLPEVMASAGRLVEAVRAVFPLPAEDAPQPKGDIFWVGNIPVPYDWVRQKAREDLPAVGAFNTLQEWCLPLISIATRHGPLLVKLVADDGLRSAIMPLTSVSGPVNFLLTLSLVPLKESFHFIEAKSRRGFALTMDGIPDNFTLHTLMSAALADALGHAPPPVEVMRCFTGEGPPSSKTPAAGAWNLYSWKAAAQGLNALDKAPLEDWIWHEGRPAGIPSFEGTRIVLGGDNKIRRGWNTQRIFAALPASVVLERELSNGEAEELLQRMTKP